MASALVARLDDVGQDCRFTYKIPKPSMAITELLTRQSSCTSHSRKMGRVAKIQSVEIDTTATAYDSAVWMLRSLHTPSMLTYQFFLFLRQRFVFLEGNKS